MHKRNSKTIEGSEGEINATQVAEGKKDLVEKGDRFAYDVHTHPNEKDADGNYKNIGEPGGSPTDVAGTHGSTINIALGSDGMDNCRGMPASLIFLFIPEQALSLLTT